MRNFFHVARNTFRECLREPIFFILLVAAVSIIGIFPSISLFAFREQIKLVSDSAMATTLVFGLIAAVLCASHTISREMSNGTVLLLLSKPIHRPVFIASKIAGIISALTVFVFICACSTLIALRVAKDQFQLDYVSFYIYYAALLLSILWGGFRNFYSSKSFAASATLSLIVLIAAAIGVSRLIPVEGKIPPIHTEVIPALILLFFAVWTMGTITVMLSAKLDMEANLLVSSVLFSAGLVSDYFFGASAGTFSFRAALYALIPNWQFFWLADALSNKKTIPWEYIGWAALYTLLYIVICGIIAVTLFTDREVAENVR